MCTPITLPGPIPHSIKKIVSIGSRTISDEPCVTLVWGFFSQDTSLPTFDYLSFRLNLYNINTHLLQLTYTHTHFTLSKVMFFPESYRPHRTVSSHPMRGPKMITFVYFFFALLYVHRSKKGTAFCAPFTPARNLPFLRSRSSTFLPADRSSCTVADPTG